MELWVQMFYACHAVTGFGVWNTSWPDGAGYIEQAALTVYMFKLIEEQIVASMLEESKRNG